MAKMWAHVALNVKDHPALLGYEIINEPFAGLIYTNIYRFFDADNVNLQLIHKEVHDEIRKVDD